MQRLRPKRILMAIVGAPHAAMKPKLSTAAILSLLASLFFVGSAVPAASAQTQLVTAQPGIHQPRHDHLHRRDGARRGHLHSRCPGAEQGRGADEPSLHSRGPDAELHLRHRHRGLQEPWSDQPGNYNVFVESAGQVGGLDQLLRHEQAEHQTWRWCRPGRASMSRRPSGGSSSSLSST